MQEQQRRFPVGIVVGLSTLVVATGGVTAFFAWKTSQNNQPMPVAVQQPQSSQTVTVPPTVTQNQIKPNQKAAAPKAEKVAQVYWLKNEASDVQPVAAAVKVEADNRQETLLAAAMNKLLSAAPGKNATTSIPAGTQLRSLKVQPDGIHVDLSKDFTIGGGSASMQGRLAQVLYTATSLNPDARVYLMVEGKPLTVLGGEGLIIDQPLTRKDFEQEMGSQKE